MCRCFLTVSAHTPPRVVALIIKSRSHNDSNGSERKAVVDTEHGSLFIKISLRKVLWLR